MKNKTKLISIVLSISALVMLVSCQQQKAEWKGSIEQVDGVTVVKNPKKPMYGEDFCIIEEELSIGEVEGREEYMFSRAWYIAVDNEERIYVMDQGGSQVKVFDKNGTFLRSIGKRGQGPGELQNPNEIFLTDNNQLVFEDFIRGLNFYSLEGKFIRSLSTAKIFPIRVLVNSKGYILALINIAEPSKNGKEIKLFDAYLNFLKTIVTIPESDSQDFNPFRPGIHWALAKYDNLVVGYLEDYELQIFNSDGELIKKINRKYDPVKITSEEIEEMKRRIKPGLKLIIPKHYPAIQYLFADDEGRIFIQTYEKVKDGNGYYFDVFDTEGRYISKISLKTRPRVWKKNKLYTIEEDENGFQMVKRYKVTWRY